MSTVYLWRHKVDVAEIDELGHANNEVYLNWINQAAQAHSAAQGWPGTAYLNLGEGWVVRRHEIEYLRPVRDGTEIVVKTWVRSLEKATSWRCYLIMTADGTVVLARAQTLWAWIHYGTGKLGRIPAEVAQAFSILDQQVMEPRRENNPRE